MTAHPSAARPPSASPSDEATEHEPGEEYAGPAWLAGEGVEPLAVNVRLRGHFEPLDGRFHWFGRIDVDDALAATHRSGAQVVLQTPYGIAAGRISDVDPWGRFRISGQGAPPF